MAKDLSLNEAHLKIALDLKTASIPLFFILSVLAFQSHSRLKALKTDLLYLARERQ